MNSTKRCIQCLSHQLHQYYLINVYINNYNILKIYNSENLQFPYFIKKLQKYTVNSNRSSRIWQIFLHKLDWCVYLHIKSFGLHNHISRHAKCTRLLTDTMTAFDRRLPKGIKRKQQTYTPANGFREATINIQGQAFTVRAPIIRFQYRALTCMRVSVHVYSYLCFITLLDISLSQAHIVWQVRRKGSSMTD